MKNTKKKKILFLCTSNSARSQMAEVLMKHKAGDRFDIYSAGTQPTKVDSRTFDALDKFGLEVKELVSKKVNIFEEQMFDYVITLCDNAYNECRSYPFAVKQLAWHIPAPKKRSGIQPFLATLYELDNRLSMFLLVEEQNDIDADAVSGINDNSSQFDNFDPISFYKSLTDEIRLKTLMLTHYHGELCVCELMQAMNEDSQPKVSRNLAILKKAQVITDRKHGQWVFYRINTDLPNWVTSVIAQTTENNIFMILKELQRLATMQNRPDRENFCK